MAIPEKNISSLIPQRPPFVMIDELVSTDERSSETSLLVQQENIFVEDGRLREPGLIENIAQTAAARAGYLAIQKNEAVQVGYIGAIKNLEIFKLPEINNVITTDITIKNVIFDVILIDGKVSCNDVILATCEMKIFITQPKHT